MRDARGLWLALLGVALSAGVPPDDELLALLEFLGESDTASEEWNGFFDNLPERLPERPDDTILPAEDPVAAEEAKP